MLRRLAIATLALAATGLAHADPHNVYGVFATPEGDSHLTLADCGDGTPCGTVTWIDPAAMAPGETPETARTKAGDPVLGLVMLKGFEKKKSDWRGGTIYDPRNDKTYASRLKRLGNGALQVKGCVGPVCQTQIWPAVTAVNTKAD